MCSNCRQFIFNPTVHFWLHHTARCAENSFCALARSFCVSRKSGAKEVDGVTCRVLCTWWLLALAVKGSWLGPGGPPPPDCMDRLRKHYSHLVGGLFLARKAAWALSGCITTDSADYCMLINSTWSKSRVCIRV